MLEKNSWHLKHFCDSDLISSKCTVCVFPTVCVMAELPSGLLEACVVVGAPSDKLRDIYQVYYTQTQRQMENHCQKIKPMQTNRCVHQLHFACSLYQHIRTRVATNAIRLLLNGPLAPEQSGSTHDQTACSPQVCIVSNTQTLK